jgi:YbbR domain-containing protein
VSQWLRRHVLHNFGTKILALALAIVLYLHVFTSQEREVLLEVPLELQAVPATLVWSGELPTVARVRFRGTGVDLLRLRTRFGSARVRVDVSEAGPGLYQRPLVTRDVVVSHGLRVAAIEVVEPRALALRFDRQGSRRLPLTTRVSGRVAPGFVANGGAIAEPDWIVMTGPAGVLDTLRAVLSEVLDVSGQNDTVTRKLRVACPKGCEASPAEVTVRVNIEKVATRTFTGLPVQVQRSRDVRLKRLTPETGTVLVSGPASMVESLSPEELRVSIDARGLPPGGVYSLMASVELRRPEAAGLIAIEPVRPESFEVELE